MVFITIVTGAFVNQQTSLGGLKITMFNVQERQIVELQAMASMANNVELPEGTADMAILRNVKNWKWSSIHSDVHTHYDWIPVR